MGRNFHESYGQAEIKPPPERLTGLLFAVIAVLVAVLWRNSPIVVYVSLGLAAVLVAGLAAPRWLKPLNMIWFQFGLLLHRVVNPLVMFVMFALVFVPAGLIMRIWHDPLRSRRAGPGSSYWIERQTDAVKERSMTAQF